MKRMLKIPPSNQKGRGKPQPEKAKAAQPAQIPPAEQSIAARTIQPEPKGGQRGDETAVTECFELPNRLVVGER